MSWPCLCGKPAPCPDHGRFVGQPYRPTPPAAHRLPRPSAGLSLLRALQEADRDSDLAYGIRRTPA